MKKIIPFLLMAFMACHNKSSDSAKFESMEKAASEASQVINPVTESSEPTGSSDRKLIKDGEISMEVKNLDQSREELTKLISQYKAYISNETQAEYDNRKVFSFSIKIPVNQYETFCESVSGLAVNIERKNLNAFDVTEEFVDTEARISAKKTLEKRYLELLSKAKNVDEMLAIERELAKVREEIEAMGGRIKFLQNQSSLSTLKLTMYQISIKSTSFMRTAGQALAGGWLAVVKFALFLLRIWPFILVLVVVLYFGKKRFRT